MSLLRKRTPRTFGVIATVGMLMVRESIFLLLLKSVCQHTLA